MSDDLRRDILLVKSSILGYFKDKLTTDQMYKLISIFDNYHISVKDIQDKCIAICYAKKEKITLVKSNYHKYDHTLQLISIIHEYIHAISNTFSSKGFIAFYEEGIADYLSKKIGIMYLEKRQLLYPLEDMHKVGYGVITDINRIILLLLNINGIKNPEILYLINRFDGQENDNYIRTISETIPESNQLIALIKKVKVYHINNNLINYLPEINRELQKIVGYYSSEFNEHTLNDSSYYCYDNKIYESLCYNNIIFSKVNMHYHPIFILSQIKYLAGVNIDKIVNKNFYSEQLKSVISNYIDFISKIDDLSYIQNVVSILPTTLIEKLINHFQKLGYDATYITNTIYSKFNEYKESVQVETYGRFGFSNELVNRTTIAEKVLADKNRNIVDVFTYLNNVEINDNNYKIITRILLDTIESVNFNYLALTNDDCRSIAIKISTILNIIDKINLDNSPDTLRLLSLINNRYLRNLGNNDSLIGKELMQLNITQTIKNIESKIVKELINIRIFYPELVKNSNYLELIMNLKFKGIHQYQLIVDLSNYNDLIATIKNMVRYQGYANYYLEYVCNEIKCQYSRLPFESRYQIGSILKKNNIYSNNIYLCDLKDYVINDILSKRIKLC